MVAEVVIGPDAEALVVEWLADVMPEVPAATRVPNPRPDELIVVTLIGGFRRDRAVDRCTVNIDSWAATSPRASLIARTVRGLLYAARDEGFLAGVPFYFVEEFSAPSSVPDPASGSPRYRYTAVLHLRGSVLSDES